MEEIKLVNWKILKTWPFIGIGLGDFFRPIQTLKSIRSERSFANLHCQASPSSQGWRQHQLDEDCQTLDKETQACNLHLYDLIRDPEAGILRYAYFNSFWKFGFGIWDDGRMVDLEF